MDYKWFNSPVSNPPETVIKFVSLNHSEVGKPKQEISITGFKKHMPLYESLLIEINVYGTYYRLFDKGNSKFLDLPCHKCVIPKFHIFSWKIEPKVVSGKECYQSNEY